MGPRSRRGSRKRPRLRAPCPRISRRNRHLARWSTASMNPRLTEVAAHGVPGPPTLRNQAQRVNMPQTSLDLFSLSSYTGSSRHRVARLSTLTRITFPSLSLFPSLALLYRTYSFVPSYICFWFYGFFLVPLSLSLTLSRNRQLTSLVWIDCSFVRRVCIIHLLASVQWLFVVRFRDSQLTCIDIPCDMYLYCSWNAS